MGAGSAPVLMGQSCYSRSLDAMPGWDEGVTAEQLRAAVGVRYTGPAEASA